MQKNIILWVIFAAIISALPVTIIKSYINNNNLFLIFLTFCCYVLLIICYLNIFKTESIIKYFIFIKILANILVIFSGIVFFKEVVTIKQSIGIVFAFLALYFISS
jgi:drug/metabolite transporter (DMT)-like permease